MQETVYIPLFICNDNLLHLLEVCVPRNWGLLCVIIGSPHLGTTHLVTVFAVMTVTENKFTTNPCIYDLYDRKAEVRL